ncbi:UDP-glucose 6-dehydrogenase [Desulfovibrionales bacterium]
MNICIVGTGYVGLVTAACFAEMGNTVRCVDANCKIITTLKTGMMHIYEPGLEDLVRRNYRQGRLIFTTSMAEGLVGVELIFITVGTPSTEDGSCDMYNVYQVAAEIGRLMIKPLIVVDKSTVPVGTADQVQAIIAEELVKRGLSIRFNVVSNPEFLKEGDAVNDFMKPDRVVIGTDDPHSVEMLRYLYAPFARSRDKLIVMSVRSAEMTKYAANCMLAIKISFINEIAGLCERAGADVHDVRAGIGADHRIGYHFIYPGVGYGGSCFPKDIKALIHTAEQLDFAPILLKSVDEVNDRQKLVLADKILRYLKINGGSMNKIVAIWGLAFKANTDDMRDAASLKIIEALTVAGVQIRAFDPISRERATEMLADNDRVTLVAEQYEALYGADVLAVVTEWNQFRNPDFKRIKTELSLSAVFDGRNLYSPSYVTGYGLTYFCIGRPDPA